MRLGLRAEGTQLLRGMGVFPSAGTAAPHAVQAPSPRLMCLPNTQSGNIREGCLRIDRLLARDAVFANGMGHQPLDEHPTRELGDMVTGCVISYSVLKAYGYDNGT